MKKKLLILFYCFSFLLGYAQPPNNTCSTAQSITPNGTCLAGTTVAATDTWNNVVGCQNGNNASSHPDVWYTFVSTGTQADFTNTAGTFVGTMELILVEGTCAGTFTLAGNDCSASPQVVNFTGLTVGATYYYTISNASGAGNTPGTFTTCVTTSSPPPVSGQDCGTAAILCDNSSFGQGSSTAGSGAVFGNASNENLSAFGCLLTDERQSKWYNFTAGCNGTIEFIIDPVIDTNDYDFAIYDITTSGCIITPGGGTAGGATQIACNYSACAGSTGATSVANPCTTYGANDCSGPPGCQAAGIIAPPTLIAGHTYALIIDNFSLTNSGFNFSWTGGSATVGPDALYTFTNTSCGVYNFTKTCNTGTFSTYLWTFGDGTTSTLQNPSHTYTTGGNYTISLEVTDALGCKKTESQTVTVGMPLIADVAVAICSPNAFTVTPANVLPNIVPTGTTYTWGAPVISPAGAITGGSAQAVGQTSISQTLTNTTSATATATYTVTASAGTAPAVCTDVFIIVVTVTPLNTIAAGTNQTVCVNSAITNITLATTVATGATFAGLPAGVTGSWAGNVATISGTPTASGTFNYTVTTIGGCPPAVATGTITVNLQNTIAAGTNQTVCINSAITNITLATTVATGATFAGLPAGVTGSWAGNVATISGTPTASGTFNYTVTTTGGCPPAVATGTITVTPQNTIAAGTNQTVCINSVITNITLATTGATGATFAGLPAGVTGSWAGNVATISGTPTASGTFNYTVTTTGGCPPAVATGTITVTPQNTIAAGTNQTVCVNSAITNITLATTVATGATFAGLPAGVTGSWAGNVATISGTPTASGTFNYTVTTTGGCPPATATGTITVNLQNTIAAGTNQTVCINSAITNITLATTVATGATFAGLPAGVTGSWAGNVATISGTPTASGTFNYTVTTTGGCPLAVATGTITVTPQNTIAAGTNQTVCINSAITNITLATTVATGATFAGLPAGVTGSWAGNVATISGTPTASGTFNYTVTTTGGCPPAVTTGTIIVTPLNTIAAGTNQTVCINSAITNITLATTGATGATFAGLPAGVTGSWAGNMATISGTPTASGTFNYTVTTTGGCPPAVATGTITVTPQNTIAVGTNQTVCINSAITNITLATTGATGATFAGLPAGVTGSWAGNVATISGTPTASGTFNYTVTTIGGCPPATATGIITVTPLNTIAAGTNQTVCINSAITNITLATTVAIGATFAGLPAGVTGSWAGNVATISGTPTASGTFNYTVTTTGGCPPATATGTITVTPQNTIAAGTNQTVCINSAITNITLATTGATGATFAGLPAGVTGSWAGNVATISGTPTASGTFNYTVTTTGGCPPAVATGTITVTPQNTIAAGTNQTVCINSAITNITLSTTGATGATFAGLPAGVIGSWAGNVATISGTPTASGTFNYTVTTTGGCPPAVATGTITVTPQNTIAAGTNQTVCINSAITNITLATTVATGATFAGLPAGVTGSWAGNVATISGTPTASGTFNYTVTTTGGCPPAVATGTITVTPQNTIAAGTNQTVCINSAITNITLATTVATGATFAGLPAGVTGSWAGNVATISGTPTVSGTFNYTVTTTGGCPPAVATGTITVTSQNTIAAGTNQTVCINSAITNITLATTVATGATFAGLPAGVTGSWAGNVATISGTPTASGTFNYTVTTTGGCPPAVATGTITVTPQNTIAAGTNQTVCINSAITNITLATTVATGATFAGLPAGVTGSWAGNVATISGTPTASGTFNYTVTTTGGCPPAVATGTITVTPQNTIAAGTSQTVCVNSAITNITLATTGATGATFAGLPAGVTGSWAGNVVTISGTPTVSGVFNYTVTTTGGCPPATATGTITVNPTATPVTGFSYSTPVCINGTNPTPTTVVGFTTGGVYSSTPGLSINASTGEINLSLSSSGTYTVTYFYAATACGAAGSSTFDITITPLPLIALTSLPVTSNQTICINSVITNITYSITNATGATVSGLPSGVSGSFSAGVYTISGIPTASGTFNYTVTTTGGCSPATATATGTITVTPQNTIAAGTNQTVCINSAITNITLATTVATGATFAGLPAGVTGSWVGNVATISGTPTASGTFNYTVTTTGGCPPAVATGTITVTPQNTIAAGTNQTVCINSAITNITLATTVATGATFAGLPAGVTGSWAGNVATISGTPTASGTFNYTVTTTGGCPPAVATGTITVTPQNTIAAGTNQTVCVNSAITNITLATTGVTGATFAGLPAGVTGSWAGNVATISGTPTASGTFNYTVTTTGGCPPAVATGTITVTPQNTIAAGTNQTVCINSAITNITLATTGATGATFAGLPAGVTGSWAGNVVTISGTPTVSGTFNYTVTTIGGCPPATATGTIIINNQPFAGTDVAIVVCPQTASAINVGNLLVDGDSGGTWAQTSGPIGNFNPMSAIFTPPSGAAASISVFTYTVAGVAPCIDDEATVTITVNDQADAGTDGNIAVCETSVTSVDLFSLITGEDLGGTWVQTSGVGGTFNAGAGTYTPAVGATTSVFTYTILGADQCFDVSSVATVNIISQNTIAAGTNQTVCINNAITSITLATTGATGATFSGLPAGVTGSWAGNVATISGTPTASGTFNYTVTTTGGCPPAVTTGTIIVTPLNTIAAGTNQTVCINSAITNITLATTGATGAIFAGLPAGVTGSWAGNVATISGTPTASGTFNYTVTTTGGCPPAVATGTITVTPQNTIAVGTNQTVCVNSAITNITLATTGATGATFAGLPAGVTGSWAGNVATISGTPTASGTFNYTVTTIGGCPPATATGTITVTPQNTIAVGTNQTVCINSAITNITLATTGATGATFAGLPAGVTGSWAGNVATISGTPTASGTFNYTVTTTGGCPPATATGIITVTPLNTIAAGTNQTVCVNSAITNITLATTGATGATFSGLPAGVTGSWAGNVATISGTPTASGTFNYTVTTTGGCPPAVATGTITVTPQNTIAAGTNQTVCINSAITNITLSTTGATGATFAGLPAGVTGSWAGNVATISGTPTASGTFNYTVTTTGGCPPAVATGTITVVVPYTATIAYANSSYCILNNNSQSVIFTGVSGGTYSASPVGLSINTTTGEILPSSSLAGNYVVTYTTPNNPACGPYQTTTNVTITPKPVLTYTVTNPICDGSTLDFVLNSNIPGTTYTWSASNNDLTGFIASGDQTNINQLVQLINPMSTNGSISMVILPSFNGCVGDPVSVTILVKPNPRIIAITQEDAALCSGETLHMDVTGEPSGLTYNWTAVNNNGVLITSGIYSGTTTGAIDLQLTTSNPLSAGTIQFEFTPIRNGCVGTPVLSAVITVNPIPGNPIGLPHPAICSGESTNINVSENLLITGTMLEWNVIASNNVTGFTQTGSGLAPISINDILVNGSNVQGFVTYRIKSVLGECEGAFTDITVLVNPLPKPVLTDGHICVNVTTGVTYQGYILDTQLSNPNFTYDWFLFNTTTNMYDPIAGASASTYEAMVAGNYQVIVTNTLTNCIGEASADVIEVFPATGISATVSEAFTDNPTITVTVNPIGTGNLIYALDNGAWQESNVFTGVEPGTHTVLVSDLEGCTNLSIEVIVIDYPKYFTPNGDGIHDTWNIIGLNQAGAKLFIFDRYGKLIKQLSVTDQSKGWDGTYNGAQLPSTDYWFTLDFIENNKQRVFKSHFSLKR